MLNRILFIIIPFGILFMISCMNGSKEKDEIKVYYTTKTNDISWKLNDGEYTYTINFNNNEKKKEKQIPEYYTLTDSIAAGDHSYSIERNTYQIKNDIKPYNLIVLQCLMN